jgi:hypothetical protein
MSSVPDFRLLEVLRRLRNGGQQYVRVEHVHVNDGGQAVVGNVKSGIRDGSADSETKETIIARDRDWAPRGQDGGTESEALRPRSRLPAGDSVSAPPIRPPDPGSCLEGGRLRGGPRREAQRHDHPRPGRVADGPEGRRSDGQACRAPARRADGGGS